MVTRPCRRGNAHVPCWTPPLYQVENRKGKFTNETLQQIPNGCHDSNAISCGCTDCTGGSKSYSGILCFKHPEIFFADLVNALRLQRYKQSFKPTLSNY